MKNYDYVPDQPHYEHPDRCGEDMEPEEEEQCPNCGSSLKSCLGNCIYEDEMESGLPRECHGRISPLKKVFMRPGAREIE